MTTDVSHIGSRAVQVIIGVDTHKDQHVAVALMGGVSDLARSTRCHLRVRAARTMVARSGTHAFGVEGTGSYGASHAS